MSTSRDVAMRNTRAYLSEKCIRHLRYHPSNSITNTGLLVTGVKVAMWERVVLPSIRDFVSDCNVNLEISGARDGEYLVMFILGPKRQTTENREEKS